MVATSPLKLFWLLPACVLTISHLVSKPEYATAVSATTAAARTQDILHPSDWPIDKSAFCTLLKYF